MSYIDIITLAIGAVTVSLLIALLVMVRTRYVLVRRDRDKPAAYANDNSPPVEPQ